MAIKQCLKGGITVISMHLNYDAAPLGTDYFLMRGLGGEEERELMVRLSVGGYGRVFDIPQTPFFKYLEDIKTTFASERIISYGNGRKTVKTVASFCGAGADDETIAFAVKNNADVFVSSDLKHHQIAELVGRGINVIQIPHYTSEVYGFKRIAQKLNEKLPVPSCFYRDKGLQ